MTASGSHHIRRVIVWLALYALAAFMFLSGIRWGLPSRDADHYLFGDRAPWSGAKILALAGSWDDDSARGADVALHPLADRAQAIWLNQTDTQIARIVRRYRLYSAQPDEASTLRALRFMQPSRLKLDPRLYQYGGLWIYPVGGLLKCAAAVGLIDLRSDVAWYLDHPEEFARFYIVTRLYSAAWGMVGVWAVWCLARRISGKFWLGAAAAACFICMPVVVNSAHEGKPHLAGMVLTLLAVIAADNYVQTGRARWWAVAGALCGAAAAMVLTGFVAFAILPVMVRPCPGDGNQSPERKRRVPSWRVVVYAALLGLAVYTLTNPYVLINLISNRAVLRSNLGTSANMYHVAYSWSALWGALRLIAEGAGPVITLLAAVAAAAWLRQRRKLPPLAWLLAAPAALVLLLFVSAAAGKPPEYGRFAIFLDVALLIAALTSQARCPAWRQVLWAIVLVLCTATAGSWYRAGFATDAGSQGSRDWAATFISLAAGPQKAPPSLAMWAEPAPYCLPPVDLFRWRLLLLPQGTSADATRADVWIAAAGLSPAWRPGTDPPPPDAMVIGSGMAPMSWADEPFVIGFGNRTPPH